MNKSIFKIFQNRNKSNHTSLSTSDRVNKLFNNKDFLDAIGRTSDILYEYDKKAR